MTANSVGAWGNNAASATEAPSYAILDGYPLGTGKSNGQIMYGNTTFGAFKNNIAVLVPGLKRR